MKKVTKRESVLAAIREADERGRDEFLAAYGFADNRGYELRFAGRTYDSKAIYGVAAKHEHGEALHPRDFGGGKHGAARWLRELGFKVAGPGDAPAPPEDIIQAEEHDPAFLEGAVHLQAHLERERSGELAALAKRQRLEQRGELRCEACGFVFEELYGDLGEGYIEAHHDAVPVAEMGEGHETRIEDIALVCANCHRMLHRAKPWLSVAELRERIEAGR